MTALKWFFASCLLLTACNKPENKLLNKKQELSEKTGIELAVIRKAEQLTHTNAMRFKRWYRNVCIAGDSVQQLPQHQVKGKTVELPGISFLVNGDSCERMVDSLNHILAPKECMAFISDDAYREDRKRVVSVIHATDKYDIIRMQETASGTSVIATDSLIARLRQLDQKYAFDLIAAGADWVIVRPRVEIANWEDYALETLKICPLEEEPEDVAAYAYALKEDKGRILMWWD